MAKRHLKRKPVLEDWHLWTEVTRSVSPLRPAPPMPAAKGGPAGPAPRKPAAKPLLQPPAAAAPRRSPADTGGLDHGRETGLAGIEPRLGRKLMRGRLPIDATIDLHGLRQSEAHAALCRFIAARQARGDRTVLVITGKGMEKAAPAGPRGVLRAMLPQWLSGPALAPLVSGWQMSAPRHGGAGAFYVRLRKAGK